MGIVCGTRGKRLAAEREIGPDGLCVEFGLCPGTTVVPERQGSRSPRRACVPGGGVLLGVCRRTFEVSNSSYRSEEVYERVQGVNLVVTSVGIEGKS